MMSGMRNDPPISINSPLETTTSFLLDKACKSKNTAAALLLTTVAASAPVNSQRISSTSSSRSPRLPSPKSYSRAQGSEAALAIASTTSGGMMARPKLVCKTVPVKLMTCLVFGFARTSSHV